METIHSNEDSIEEAMVVDYYGLGDLADKP